MLSRRHQRDNIIQSKCLSQESAEASFTPGSKTVALQDMLQPNLLRGCCTHASSVADGYLTAKKTRSLAGLVAKAEGWMRKETDTLLDIKAGRHPVSIHSESSSTFLLVPGTKMSRTFAFSMK